MNDSHMNEVRPAVEKFAQEWKDHGFQNGKMQVNHPDGNVTVLEMVEGLMLAHHLETLPMGDYRHEMPKPKKALKIPAGVLD